MDFIVFIFYKAQSGRRSKSMSYESVDERTRNSFALFLAFFTPFLILIILGKSEFVKRLFDHKMVFMSFYLLTIIGMYYFIRKIYPIEKIRRISDAYKDKLVRVNPGLLKLIIVISWMILLIYFVNKILETV